MSMGTINKVKIFLPLLIGFLTLPQRFHAQNPASVVRNRSADYSQVQNRLCRGWNTWDAQSVTSHVLLPEGLAVRIGLLNSQRLYGDAFLSTAQIGNQNPGAEQVTPGAHAYNGSYTDLRITWHNQTFRIQTASQAGDIVLLISPIVNMPVMAATLRTSPIPMTAVFSVGFLWNQPGVVTHLSDRIEARSGSRRISFYLTGIPTAAVDVPLANPYFSATLDQPIGLSSGKPRNILEIRTILDQQHAAYNASIEKTGSSAPVADAIQSVLGWDTTYDPENHRVISPVSRVWSIGWGGYVLFDWDTFFASSLAAVGDHDLAVADAIEVLNEVTPEGFVPNFARASGFKSGDRSEPPVGSITILNLYKAFRETWLLRDTFPKLLAWNRWWANNRDHNGYLVWGSNLHGQPENLDDSARGTLQGARYESGLDNSPMYDDATFDNGLMMLADVGLLSMYVADCDALAVIAGQLGKAAEAAELTARAQHYRVSLATLWDERTGIYRNKDLITGKFSQSLSPTNFYPLLARVPTSAQADRMIREHLENPAEFGGEYVIPSIARNDPSYKDQTYWRGRIWGPMNYLVYLGLRNYDQPLARENLSEKSLRLFLIEWKQNGHVHENYNATNGLGDDVHNSDRFYHWGALLGLIPYMEETEPIPHVP